MRIRDRIRELKRVPARELRPNPKNWRTHPKEQQDAMRGVLAEVGWADAVLARETDAGLMLLDGHLRADVAPEAEIPVLVLDVSDEEADKILATHDPLAAGAGVDESALSSLLSDIEFESQAIEDLLESLGLDDKTPGEVEDVESQTNYLEELQAQWRTEPGQLWEIRGHRTHRLLCGDSTDEASVTRLLDGAVPFLMVTDPPYGVDYDPNWRNGAGLQADLQRGSVTNDDRADWSQAFRHFPGDVAYTWFAGLFAGQTQTALAATKFTIRAMIVWRKSTFVIGRGHYHWQHEPCWYAVRKGKSSKWCGDRSQSTTWEIEKPRSSETGHGTQKPIECMARPIRNHGGRDDTVYEPFLGSGTTMLAADQLERQCFAMEISPAYVAVALQRMTDAGCECRCL